MKKISKLVMPCNPKEYASTPGTLGGQALHVDWSANGETTILEGKICLVGVPDDRGVRVVGGNIGAADGPQAFRKEFYKLYDTQQVANAFIDVGNLTLASDTAGTHECLAIVVERLLVAGARLVVVVGGGHDFSYGSYLGYSRAVPGVIPIINLDAHYDLRAPVDGKISSGTPFYRIIESCGDRVGGGQLLLELGIQPQRNHPSLHQMAKEKNIPTVVYDALDQSWKNMLNRNVASPKDHLEQHFDFAKKTFGWDVVRGDVHLSLDLDVFTSSSAPGTSAATPFGCLLQELGPVIRVLGAQKSCKIFDIAELCPPRDTNAMTSRLAAQIAYDFIAQRISSD